MLYASREFRPEDGLELCEGSQFGDVTAEGGAVFGYLVEEVLMGGEDGVEALQAAG